jgi:hypothetical protein
MLVRFTQAQLTDLFKESVNTFFAKETTNILSGVSERSLCSRLAMYLEDNFSRFSITGNYNADTEYNRKQNGEVKTILDDQMQVIVISCDLLVHSRGMEVPDNLITIEMKKSHRPEAEKQSDKNRLRAMTKKQDVYSTDGQTNPEHVCGYIIGIYMEINNKARTCLFEKYKGGNIIDNWNEAF